jgi:patatin-like phospholipase/acyl hydrolase
MSTIEAEKQSVTKRREFKILSIDGGGIRGLLPATFLCEIESKIKEPIWKYFDLITGTSTGGIIALALAAGYTCEKIQKMYDEMASKVFPKKVWIHKLFAACLGSIYDISKLEHVLKLEYINEGKPLCMRDGMTRLCIPAIDLTNGKVTVYKTPHSAVYPKEKTFFADADKEMWQVALATSAAPIYFRPARLHKSYCADGGLWANNPSLVGIVEAIQSGYELNEIIVLSLGTGESAFQVEQNVAKNIRLWHWAPNGLIDLSFQSQSQAVQNQIRSLLMEANYMRIQHGFQNTVGISDITRMDDLKAAAHNLYREHGSSVIERFFSKHAVDPYKRHEEVGHVS